MLEGKRKIRNYLKKESNKIKVINDKPGLSKACSVLSREGNPGGGALLGTENPGGIIVGALETVGGYWSKEPPKNI